MRKRRGVLVFVVVGENARHGVSDKKRLPLWTLGFDTCFAGYMSFAALEACLRPDWVLFWMMTLGAACSWLSVAYAVRGILRIKKAGSDHTSPHTNAGWRCCPSAHASVRWDTAYFSSSFTLP